MTYIKTSNELYHYGMPRRSGRYPYGSGDRPYQHGSAQKKRSNDKKSGYYIFDKQKTVSDMSTDELNKYNSRRKAEEKYNQYQKQDRYKEEGLNKLETLSNISNNVNNVVNNTTRQIDETFREEHRRQKANIDLSDISDEDLRRIVNRMNMERQYRDLSPVVISDGEKKLKQVLSVVGPILSTTASALAIAVAVKKLMIDGGGIV